MLEIEAQYFDGRQARAQPCLLRVEGGALCLLRPNAPVLQTPLRQVVWPEHTRHGAQQLLLPNGGVVALGDPAAWDRFADQAGLVQPLAARWALSWRHSVMALGLVLLAMAAAWVWVVPWGAGQAIRWIPAALEARIGERVMADIDARWLQPSTLPVGYHERLQSELRRLLQSGYPAGDAPPIRLHLRQAPKWLGPNAFALPGGDVVVTDALVTLMQGKDLAEVDPAVLGIVAHEVGHVRYRHGLRLVMEAGAASVIAGWWLGDFSAVLTAAPAVLVQASYQRDHERQADQESLRLMQAAGIDPRHMVRFFRRLKEALPEHDGDTQLLGLASHPADSERMQFFGAPSAPPKHQPTR